MPDITHATARTITVRPRGVWRLRRLKIEYPPLVVSNCQLPHYDAALARELVNRTGEIPFTRRGLLALLTEYRWALTSLVAQPEKTGDAAGKLITLDDEFKEMRH